MTLSDRFSDWKSGRGANDYYTQEIIPLNYLGLVVKINIVLTYLLLIVPVLVVGGIVLAVRQQSKVTRSFSVEEQEEDARVYAESTKAMEATVAEALAEKARDPRLASMTNEDLVYEVLKECFDPEIPLPKISKRNWPTQVSRIRRFRL